MSDTGSNPKVFCAALSALLCLAADAGGAGEMTCRIDAACVSPAACDAEDGKSAHIAWDEADRSLRTDLFLHHEAGASMQLADATPGQPLRAVAFDPDRAYLLSVYPDGSLRYTVHAPEIAHADGAIGAVVVLLGQCRMESS